MQWFVGALAAGVMLGIVVADGARPLGSPPWPAWIVVAPLVAASLLALPWARRSAARAPWP